MIKAMDRRHVMYNEQLAYVAKAEQEGRCLVIRPEGKIPIGHISHDPKEMNHVYQLGREIGKRYIERIKDFWEI
jgi:predicted patatin/cPLA2 family phospholipase